MNSTAVAPYEFTGTGRSPLRRPRSSAPGPIPTGSAWFNNDAQPGPNEPIEVDLRVGGVWRQLMVISEETAYYTGGKLRDFWPLAVQSGWGDTVDRLAQALR